MTVKIIIYCGALLPDDCPVGAIMSLGAPYAPLTDGEHRDAPWLICQSVVCGPHSAWRWVGLVELQPHHLNAESRTHGAALIGEIGDRIGAQHGKKRFERLMQCGI